MPQSRTYRILDSVDMTMRDGCTLRADIWLPAGEGPWPVLLQRTPYRREDAFGTQHISAMDFMAALRRGYAIVLQDTRGRYGSDGDFNPFVHEMNDGADTIALLREQDFCNGEVVMFGASYVGATQVLAAAGNPEGLIAISPHLTTGRHGETWAYRGGAVELGFLLLWIIESLGATDLERRMASMPSEEAERARCLLASLQDDPQAGFARLPVLDGDLVLLAPYAQDWFDAARAQVAGSNREHLDALARTRLPALVSCGWNDLFVEGSLELFATLRARWGKAEEVRDRLIVGPWSHGNPADWQGDVWHGYAASTVGLAATQLDFFDSARAGHVPAFPMVRYFRSGSNTWHDASDWPLPGTRTRNLFLSREALDEAVPTEPWSRAFVSDTLNPVPTIGGANFLPGLLSGRNSAAKAQERVEARDDVLIFTSAPLQEDLEVTGLIEASIWVSSTGRSADWTARLCIVGPDGKSLGLVDGIFRQAEASSDPVEIAIRLGHISHLFHAGTRLRLQIASSNFPRFDRNPQSATPAHKANGSDFVIATHHVHGGPDMLSRLVLSIV